MCTDNTDGYVCMSVVGVKLWKSLPFDQINCRSMSRNLYNSVYTRTHIINSSARAPLNATKMSVMNVYYYFRFINGFFAPGRDTKRLRAELTVVQPQS